MRDSSPPKYLALHAKVFLAISTIYSTILGHLKKKWDKTLALV